MKQDGRDIELFAVRELSKGIVLIAKFPRFLELEGGNNVEIDEQHYSVHPSKGGADTSITQKIRLADGTIREHVAYIHGTKDYLLWPIYARRLPIYFDDRRVVRPKPRDRVIHIGKYSTSRAMGLYSVFVANRSFDHSFLHEVGARVFSAELREYKIIVFSTFLNVPSINEGDLTGWTTTPVVINKVRGADHFQIRTGPLEAHRLSEVHWSLVSRLRSKFVWRMEKILEGEQPWMDRLISGVAYFTAVSLEEFV